RRGRERPGAAPPAVVARAAGGALLRPGRRRAGLVGGRGALRPAGRRGRDDRGLLGRARAGRRGLRGHRRPPLTRPRGRLGRAAGDAPSMGPCRRSPSAVPAPRPPAACWPPPRPPRRTPPSWPPPTC